MTRARRSVSGILYTAALLGSLGFGVTQAFGTPAERSTRGGAPYCDPVECNRRCGEPGGECLPSGFCACVL